MTFGKMPTSSPSNTFNLPRRLRRLTDLAYNLWWTWGRDADQIFELIDRETWEVAYHNPVSFLRLVEHDHLVAATHDSHYLDLYDRVIQAFDDYMNGGDDTWYARHHPEWLNQPVAYFCAEFGLHEALPIYAGGLGVLSGDYLKEASDLGMPLVAVGILYKEGYFIQGISKDGRQEAHYADLSFSDLPMYPVLDDQGEKLTVEVELPGRDVHACLWRVHVGRVPLYLLDCDIENNKQSDRDLTARLYVSDMELRISQEIILGIGGVRALHALGYKPAVWHLNEGHSAFLTLERVRQLTADGSTFEEARDKTIGSTVFTTHTPVPAGHDEFPHRLIDKYFNAYWPQLNLERMTFLDLAYNKQPWGEMFNMTILAMHMSGQINGVSELHGQVARQMWSHLWPNKPVDEVPIVHITNGIHTYTWLARRLQYLYDKYLGPDWMERLDEPEIWENIGRIPDDELWEVRRHLKHRLVAYICDRASQQRLPGKVLPGQMIARGIRLNPDTLTLGFARRFATYKRANLILRDPERLLRLINHPSKPVQVIFTGKAHPADEPGKHLIQEVYQQVKRADNEGRLVFLEDYDMNLARYLIQGVDVWLNTPRRPNEASGTSGQKAAINGVLNLSVLDGWWREGFNGSNGWAIGEDRDYEDMEVQDEKDAENLYQTLEEEVIPLYYQRSADDLPSEWLGLVKQSIITLAPRFSMRRMVKEYVSEMYQPVLPG
ncbi:MAG: alpha-glucan family phosphorylase [Anaerolineales bacterium]